MFGGNARNAAQDEDDDNGRYHSAEAINIPAGSSLIGHPGLNNRQISSTSAKRSMASDPFNPFSQDDEVPFYMEPELIVDQEAPGFDNGIPTWHAPLSYSAIAKANLKDSGVTSGVTIDSRRNEPLCPYILAGNCRYGDRCHYLHGMPCPSCFKLVLHPYQTEEEHQKHILDCMNKQVQVAPEGTQLPEEITCCICLEKVLSKNDARFGLLNCEHAFCLQCIRQWRSNNSLDNQVVRSCPICRVISHFITPSAVWIVDRAEKSRVIKDYH